jgi:hypothetical protein
VLGTLLTSQAHVYKLFDYCTGLQKKRRESCAFLCSAVNILEKSYMRKLLGVDFHILLTLLQRGWTILAGAVMVCFLPFWFSRVEQGYYYAFSSLIALQIFFELGFNYVVVQFVGHEIAHVKLSDKGEMSGDEYHISRLASLLFLLKRWYRVVGILFFVAVSYAGALFFKHEGELAVASWLSVWVLLVFFTAVNLYFSPYLAVLEGCGKVGQVARLRLVQSVVGYSLSWVAFALKAGLWAVPILPAVGGLCTAYWLHFHGDLLRNLARQKHDGSNQIVSWRREIFPFQWRIALSWMSGYFIFYLFTPLIFANQGAVEAGRIGMALAVFNSLSTFGISWVNAKAPVFAAHIARAERSELNRLFMSVTQRSILFIASVSLMLIFAVYVMRRLDIELSNRIASLPVLVVLAVVTVANALVYSAAVYMRAHKEEPMVYVSVCLAVLTSIGVYFGSRVGVFVTVSVYAIINLVVGLPWSALLFLTYFRRTE